MKASVSVIIPCFRCAETVLRAVESVMAQTLLPQEILLIDDFSDDAGRTLTVLKSLQKTYQQTVNIKIIQLDRNYGPGEARNFGWDLASQPYIAFLDADDSWHPKKIQIQYQWMVEHLDVAMSGHRSVWLQTGMGMPDLSENVSAKVVSRTSLLITNCFPTRSVMLQRGLIARFVQQKRYAEDYLLWLTLIFGGQTAVLLDAPLAYSYKADFGESGLTADLWNIQKGVFDTYNRLFIADRISFLVFTGLILLSLIKFMRRLVIVRFKSTKGCFLNFYARNK